MYRSVLRHFKASRPTAVGLDQRGNAHLGFRNFRQRYLIHQNAGFLAEGLQGEHASSNGMFPALAASSALLPT